MPRRARPWYRADRDMWYVTIGGRQVPLGVTGQQNEAAAGAAFESLLSTMAFPPAPPGQAPPPVPPDPPPLPAGPTVRDLCDRFLASARRRQARGKIGGPALVNYCLALTAFVEAFGPRPAGDFTTEAGAEEVEDWAALPRQREGKPDRPWSSSTQHNYLGVILGAFKLAGLRTHVRRPPKTSRGASDYLTDEQFGKVLALACKLGGKARNDLRELLTGLRESGARPSELARLTVEDVDWPNACTRLAQHKTVRHTGKARIIHFNAAAMRILEAQRVRYGSGLLFRTAAGNAYRPGVLVRRVGIVAKRVGFRVTANGLGRHSFATKALVNGAPDSLVAELLGHKGTTMLTHHYAHLGQHAAELKEAAEKASGKRAG